MKFALRYGLVAIALLGLALGGCSKKKEEPKTGPVAAAPTPAEPAAAAADAATTPPVETPPPEPVTPVVELVTPSPQPLHADWPAYAKGTELPADQYTSNATVDGKPANVTLKTDMVIAGIPCSTTGETKFWSGEAFSSCTLAHDFAIEGIALQQGTVVTIHPSGLFNSFILPKPQLVKDLPLPAGIEINLTPRFELSSVVLANAATVQGMEFPAGTALDWDSNDEKHPLQSAKLAARATVLGTEYPAGAHLYFDAEGKIRMVRGVAKAPAEPLTCPEKTTLIVESTHGGYPAGLAWAEVAGTNLYLNSRQKPLLENDGVYLSLANYALPADFDVWNAAPADGQAIVRLQVTRANGAPLEVGTYLSSPNGGDDYYASPSLLVTGGSTLQFDSWQTEGSVEIVSVTADRICGRFDLRDPHTHLKGEFNVAAPAQP